MQSLEQIYNKVFETHWMDKNSSHSYLPIYEQLLASYRTTAKNILEIGLFGGGSLLMWEQYFAGNVHGIDCSETPHDGLADLRPMIAEGNHLISIFDATDAKEIKKHFEGITFDVIIEDAGHEINQQIEIYYNFKPYLKKGAIYIIEDIQDVDKMNADLKSGKLLIYLGEEKTLKIIDRRKIKGRYDDVLVVIK